MRRFFPLAVAGIVMTLAAAPAVANEVTIERPWARATPAGADNGAAYLTIRNQGSEDVLTGATSDAANVIELHGHVMEDSVMRMRRFDGIPIPGNGSVSLRPGSLHIMLIGLRRPLIEGETLFMTLHFAKAGDVAVAFPVMAVGARDDHNH